MGSSGNVFYGDRSRSLTTTFHRRSLRLCPRIVYGLSSNSLPGFTESLLFAANVLPYEYWPLVLGVCTVSQHLSIIFIFLAVFTRLLDHTLDPRLLVVLSSVTFVAGFILWESIEYFGSNLAETTPSDRRTLLPNFWAGALID